MIICICIFFNKNSYYIQVLFVAHILIGKHSSSCVSLCSTANIYSIKTRSTSTDPMVHSHKSYHSDTCLCSRCLEKSSA